MVVDQSRLRDQLPPNRSRPVPGRPRLRVLQALAPPDGTTRYVDQIVEGVPPEVQISYRSWRSVFAGRYDVLHLHWPEKLITSEGKARSPLRGLLFAALLIRLRWQRVAVVRTLHNVNPHEALPRRWQQRLLDWSDRNTTLYITINPITQPPAESESVTILHGHYRDQFAQVPTSAARPGRLLFFGLIRGYKGIDRLLAAFAESDDPNWQLRVVGMPVKQALVDDIRRAADADPRISACLRNVPDETLVAEISGSELVVLPYHAMHNSGAVLLALSLDRPVLVPRTPVNQALADEVGGGWIYLYDGELTVDAIRDALQCNAVAAGRRAQPDLRGRDWATVGEDHYQAYLRAVSLARPGRGSGNSSGGKT